VRPLRRPLLLWFTHWRDSRALRLAERAATRVLSVGSASFPFPTPKLIVTGHGVEVPSQPVPQRSEDGVLRLLALGRTSPAKGLDAIVEAVAALEGLPVVAELRGPSLTVEEQACRAALEARIAAGGLGERVRLEDPVPQRSVEAVYARNDVLVSNMRAGALDKVVFEAAAAGLPVLVASPGFDPLVEGLGVDLRFVQDDSSALAARVRDLYAAGPDGRRSVGLGLRARVAREHSVEHWADRVVEAAR
jgi:glycosyltransferase involved in cell wall biosynthesis